MHCVQQCITFVHMNKETTIVIRTEEQVKDKLIKLAKENKREFSDYMRLLYEYAIEKKLKF